MVSIDNRWKLDPSCKFEGYRIESGNPHEQFQKILDQKKIDFTDESRQWVEKKVIDEDDFRVEKEARETLLQAFLLYAKTREKYFKWNNIKNNYLIALHETFETMKKELDFAANKLFTFELNGQKMVKERGETMEHYLMMEIILQYLNDFQGGVKDFHEEYSKLKEVLQKIAKGKNGKNTWKEASKRADLYVMLNDGKKLWIEIERTSNSKVLNAKLKKISAVNSLSPELIDKVIFVFPDLLYAMTEGLLVEARKVGFPEDKLEIFEVNLRENQIIHAVNPLLVETEFGDGLLDKIGDGAQNPTGKMGILAKNQILRKIIKPLVNDKPEQQWINERQEKTKRLIRFWRMRTGKFTASASELKFKEKAVRKIKKDYSFLIS
jgi:hypothetical protein